MTTVPFILLGLIRPNKPTLKVPRARDREGHVCLVTPERIFMRTIEQGPSECL